MSRYQKGKPIWILLKQKTASGSGISWAIMHVCTSLQTDNNASTPTLKFFHRPDANPAAQATASHTAFRSGFWRHRMHRADAVYRVGQKSGSTDSWPQFCQICTDLKKSFFNGRFLCKFVGKWILKISPHLAYVATLPCETLLSTKQAINDKL